MKMELENYQVEVEKAFQQHKREIESALVDFPSKIRGGEMLKRIHSSNRKLGSELAMLAEQLLQPD